MNSFLTLYADNIKANYGFFHVYAFTMTLGIVVSVLLSYIRLKRKKVPLDSLIWSVFFIIPLSLFGASFFGKINPDDPIPFIQMFYFWNGGMSIHGGVLFGCVAGLIYFYFIGKKLNISLFVYADAIIPNILLGQVIGRWGNFFNHELLGTVVSKDSLNWLPSFIRDNCYAQGEPGVFRQPIFLYESFGNFMLWLFIVFVMPNIFHIYNKDEFFNRKNVKNTSWKHDFYEQRPTLIEQDKVKQYSTTKEKLTYINQINNPKKLLIMRAGVQTGVYFMGWNFIRVILETQRDDADLFLPHLRVLDLTIISLISIIGLLFTILSQFIFPYYLRKNNYLYEKEYIDSTIIKNWNYEYYFNRNLFKNAEYTFENITILIKKMTMYYIGYKNIKEFDKYFEIKLKKWDKNSLYYNFILTPTDDCKKKFKIKKKYNIILDYKFNFNKVFKIKKIEDINNPNLNQQLNEYISKKYNVNPNVKFDLKKYIVLDDHLIDIKENNIMYNTKIINLNNIWNKF